MRNILISIKPEYVAKILNGDKTTEIRKTAPKCELPCKVYIYCTKEKSYLDRLVQNHNAFYYTVRELVDFDADDYGLYYDIAGKNGEVVAEFTLKQVDEIKMPTNLSQEFMSRCCLNGSEVMSYLGGNFYKNFYAWHIDDLKIYDEPRELSEFVCRKPLKQPPMDWCYVEENSDVES